MRYGGLIVAIVLAAIAAVVVLRMSAGEAQPTITTQSGQQVNAIKIYVAQQNIPVGSTITDAMVAQQDWPEHLAAPGFIKVEAGAAGITGMVARSAFQQGEPIIKTKLANPNDPNFLAGELPAGMRVITIPVNEVDGLAGFVFPGDRVDVIYTHDVDKWESSPAANGAAATASLQKSKKTLTETLLTNVKIMAVDQRSSSDGSTDKNGKLVIPKSASLMVSQVDSQRVRLAQKTGTLSLALRSLSDKESADPLLLTAAKDISLDKDDQTQDGIKIIRGAPDKNKEIESFGAGVARGVSRVSGLAAVGNAGASPSVNPGVVAQ